MTAYHDTGLPRRTAARAARRTTAGRLAWPAGLVWALLLAVAPAAAQPLNAETLVLRHELPAHSRFGAALALDGDAALVGAPGEGTEDEPAQGAAYAYALVDGQWFLRSRLIPDDAFAHDRFGRALALDGASALIGAPLDNAGHIHAGSVYAFRAAEGGWVQEAKFYPTSPLIDARFGSSLSLDGDLALVGAPGADLGVPDGGAAYVFRRTGEDWAQEARLAAPEAVPGSQFGKAVALSGEVALVSAPHTHGAADYSGAVYVFERRDGTWPLTATLLPTDAAPYQLFGQEVALQGATAFVTAPMYGTDDDGPFGAAFVFERTGQEWRETEVLTPREKQSASFFGNALAVDGDWLAVGAPRHDGVEDDAGRVVLFERTGTTWREVASHELEDPGGPVFYGGALAVSADGYVLAAAHLKDNVTANSGEVFFLTTGRFVSAENPEAPPRRFAVHPPSPNPFRTATTVRFDLPEPGRVVVAVYDLLGRRVALVSDEAWPAGRAHQVTWRASGASAGPYFIRVEAGGRERTVRAIRVR